MCGTLLKKGAGSCEARYLNSQKFEALVINKIKEHILTEENLQELVRLVNEEMDSTAGNYREELEVILAKLLAQIAAWRDYTMHWKRASSILMTWRQE